MILQVYIYDFVVVHMTSFATVHWWHIFHCGHVAWIPDETDAKEALIASLHDCRTSLYDVVEDYSAGPEIQEHLSEWNYWRGSESFTLSCACQKWWWWWCILVCSSYFVWLICLCVVRACLCVGESCSWGMRDHISPCNSDRPVHQYSESIHRSARVPVQPGCDQDADQSHRSHSRQGRCALAAAFCDSTSAQGLQCQPRRTRTADCVSTLCVLCCFVCDFPILCRMSLSRTKQLCERAMASQHLPCEVLFSSAVLHSQQSCI